RLLSERLPRAVVAIARRDVAARGHELQLERERRDVGAHLLGDARDGLRRAMRVAAREHERRQCELLYLEPPTWMRAPVTVWPVATSRYGRTWRDSVGLPSSRITTTSPRASEKFERPAP